MSRPVLPVDVEIMAWRLEDAAAQAGIYAGVAGLENPTYLRARRAVKRRHTALRRLAEALGGAR